MRPIDPQHTPGPWSFEQDSEEKWMVGPDGPHEVVADVYGHMGLPGEENARLIAAAPELLLAAFDLCDMLDDSKLEPATPLCNAVARLQNAIRSATRSAMRLG